MRLKSFIKAVTPPILLAPLRGRFGRSIDFAGDHASWAEAAQASTGYDSALILERVTAALVKVRDGEAAYERDSVLFDRVLLPFPVLAALLRVAATRGGQLSVLDFGGSLGSSYFQCRGFLSGLARLRWSIVEQPAFVARGRELFQTEALRFYGNLAECLSQERPDVVLLSSVLQYLEDPHALLERLSDGAADHMIIDRTPCIAGERDRLTVQHVSPRIYPASYPAWLLGLARLRAAPPAPWRLVAEFDALDGHVESSAGPVDFKGFVFERGTP
jgi:putative methyltransferase (TIGR04325 family)